MQQLRIDRSKWLRGNAKYSRLYNPTLDGMCCLGFVCNDLLALPLDQIRDIGSPRQCIPEKTILTFLDPWGYPEITDFTLQAMTINDYHDYSDEEREERLINLFKENGIELSFFGEGNPSEKATD